MRLWGQRVSLLVAETIYLGMKKLVLASFIFLIWSCKHEISQPDVPTPPGTISENCDPDSVYFEQDVLPLLVSNCAMSGCHDAASHEDNIILDSFANVVFGDSDDLVVPGNPNASELIEVITEDDPDKIMPPPSSNPLTEAQIDLLYAWISQGALNNACQGCDSSNFSFSSAIQPMISTFCAGCHSGADPNGGLDLTTHAGVIGAVSYSDLLGRVNGTSVYDPMPPSGNGLSDCQLEQLQGWIDAGMPNN